MVVRTLALGAALAFGLAAAASAAVTVAPIDKAGGAIVRIAEACGAGMWRGPEGACHPMAKGRVCPAGHHLGPDGHRCWPN